MMTADKVLALLIYKLRLKLSIKTEGCECSRKILVAQLEELTEFAKLKTFKCGFPEHPEFVEYGSVAECPLCVEKAEKVLSSSGIGRIPRYLDPLPEKVLDIDTDKVSCTYCQMPTLIDTKDVPNVQNLNTLGWLIREAVVDDRYHLFSVCPSCLKSVVSDLIKLEKVKRGGKSK